MPDRRAFLRGSLLAGLAACPAPAQQDDKQNEGARPDPIAAEVEARMAVVLARYGDRLDDAARKTVRGDVESVVKRARRLREFPLTNADGPALLLVPYRAPAEAIASDREPR
jgi:hypothetical protein